MKMVSSKLKFTLIQYALFFTLSAKITFSDKVIYWGSRGTQIWVGSTYYTWLSQDWASYLANIFCFAFWRWSTHVPTDWEVTWNSSWIALAYFVFFLALVAVCILHLVNRSVRNSLVFFGVLLQYNLQRLLWTCFTFLKIMFFINSLKISHYGFWSY